MVGIFVFNEIIQNCNIVSYKVHILLNKFNKFSSKLIWMMYSVRPVCQSSKCVLILLTLKAYIKARTVCILRNIICWQIHAYCDQIANIIP